MHQHQRAFVRRLLVLCTALVLALYGAPAFAHGGDDAEAEVDGLEVEVRPAIVKAGHPVLVKAEFELDDDDDDAEDESEDDADEAEDDSDDDDSDDSDAADDEASDDDDDESDTQSASFMRRGDDDCDADDDEDCEAEEEDSEEEAEDACDDEDAEDDDESDDDADEDDSDDSDEDDSDDEGDDADDDAECEQDDAHADESCEDDDDAESTDDADDADADDEESDHEDDGDLQRQGRGQGRGRGGCGEAGALQVAFTVDFGDGGGPVEMDGRGHGKDKAKGHARHVFAEEGEYEVTVIATPEGGAPVEATVVVHVGKGAGRLSGRDRFETGTELSNEAFPEDGSAPAVVLARADGFADALASASLATLRDAPVLLTSTDQLPESVLTELQRVLADGGTVFILGGESAISADVATQLEGLGYVVERISGEDRIATALQVAQALLRLGAEFDEVVLANAGNFPDALAGAAHAAKKGAPVLLTGGETLDPRVKEFLAGLDEGTEVLVAGGPSVISDAIVAEIEALGLEVDRKGGKNRFATSAVIAAEEFPDATSVVIATGKTFPDALAGAAHAGRLEAPVLLVGDELPDEVRAYLEDGAGRINVVYVIGGPNAVSENVMAEIMEILGL